MSAIVTKFLPATDTKGSRIRATSEEGSTTISYPHEYRDVEAHAEAARQHGIRFPSIFLRGQRVLRGGRLPDGRCAFFPVNGSEVVFVPGETN